MVDWVAPIRDPILAMGIKIWGYVPNVLAAIVIFIAGLVVSKMAANIIGKVLKLSKLDTLSEKSGLEKILAAGEIKLTISGLIETLVYWALVLLVVVTAAQALKFTAAVDLIARLIAYIPRVIAAILILAVGFFVSTVLGSMVSAVSKNTGVKKANLLTKLTKGAVIILAAVIALEQLHIGAALITQIISIALISVGAGFAIAFGLGCKDLVSKSVNEFLNSLK